MNTKANGFRLPTEEEWEYAARGGQYNWYSGSNYLDDVGWYNDNSGYETHPVAQKKANGYGLYDMSGNVCEWCWDVDVDPDFGIRYYCGGDCKVSSRNYDSARDQYNYIGFRILCSTSN